MALRRCEASRFAPRQCNWSQVTATGFHHLRHVVRSVEEYATLNAAGPVSGILASVDDGEVGTLCAVSLCKVPPAQVPGELNVSEEEVDLLTRLKKREGTLGSARFDNLPSCIPKLTCQNVAYYPFILDE